MMQLINSYHNVAAEDGDDPQDDSFIDNHRLTPVVEEEDKELVLGNIIRGELREEEVGEEEGSRCVSHRVFRRYGKVDLDVRMRMRFLALSVQINRYTKCSSTFLFQPK